MKKLATLILSLAIGYSGTASADVFGDYQQLGSQILTRAEDVNSDSSAMIADLKILIGFGYQIMDLWAAKYPECLAQFQQIKSEDKNLQSMSYEEIDVRYHDGKGLIVAPKTCYIARSMIVHPYQVIALLKDGYIDSEKETVLHEIEEVTERAPKIKSRL